MKKIMCIIMFMFATGFCDVSTDEPTDYIDGKWFRCPAVVTYNENSDTIQIREYGHTTEYHYDGNGRQQYRKIYEDNGYHSTTRYSYDSNGRLVEGKSRWFRFTFKRDAAGHVIEEARFIRGSLDGKSFNTYDTEGNKIYQKTTNGNGVVQSETWYNYSDNVMVSSLLLYKDKSYSEINEYYPDGTVRYKKSSYTGNYSTYIKENCGTECVAVQENWYTPHGDEQKHVWVLYNETDEVVDSDEFTYEIEYDSLGRIVRNGFGDKFIYFERGNTVYRCYDE